MITDIGVIQQRPSGLFDPTYKPLRKVEVIPTGDPKEFIWKCPVCINLNVELKTKFSDNHQFQCTGVNCSYSMLVSVIPDDMRHWMQNINPVQAINQRPRIVRI